MKLEIQQGYGKTIYIQKLNQLKPKFEFAPTDKLLLIDTYNHDDTIILDSFNFETVAKHTVKSKLGETVMVIIGSHTTNELPNILQHKFNFKVIRFKHVVEIDIKTDEKHSSLETYITPPITVMMQYHSNKEFPEFVKFTDYVAGEYNEDYSIIPDKNITIKELGNIKTPLIMLNDYVYSL